MPIYHTMKQRLYEISQDLHFHKLNLNFHFLFAPFPIFPRGMTEEVFISCFKNRFKNCIPFLYSDTEMGI